MAAKARLETITVKIRRDHNLFAAAPTLLLSTLLLSILLPLLSAGASAQVCVVPGDHSTVQDAVDDLTCTLITLGAMSYVESVSISRDLTLQGITRSTSRIEGSVTVDGATSDVVIADLAIDTSEPPLAGCFSDALSVVGGAQVEARNVDVRNRSGACGVRPLIFADGFESGDTNAWSRRVP